MASRSGVNKLLTRGGSGGSVVRQLLPAAIGAGGVLGFLRWQRRNRGLRHDVEAELKRSSRYFELSRDLVCTAGFDGYFKQINAAWTDALGWTEAELHSRPLVEFVHDDDRARTEEETAGLRAGGVTIDFVNRFATKDGGWRWIEWSSMAIVEEELIYASARDVTQRKVIEAALERSDHRTRQIVENARSTPSSRSTRAA